MDTNGCDNYFFSKRLQSQLVCVAVVQAGAQQALQSKQYPSPRAQQTVHSLKDGDGRDSEISTSRGMQLEAESKQPSPSGADGLCDGLCDPLDRDFEKVAVLPRGLFLLCLYALRLVMPACCAM